MQNQHSNLWVKSVYFWVWWLPEGLWWLHPHCFSSNINFRDITIIGTSIIIIIVQNSKVSSLLGCIFITMHLVSNPTGWPHPVRFVYVCFADLFSALSWLSGCVFHHQTTKLIIIAMYICLFQGKLQVEERGAQGFSQPHNFVPHLFVPPSNCDYCYQMIIGILNKGNFSFSLINQQAAFPATED